MPTPEPEAPGLNTEVWDSYLRELQAAGTAFSVYLVNGIKLNFAHLVKFDDVCLCCASENKQTSPQLITRHAVSTLAPGVPSTHTTHKR